MADETDKKVPLDQLPVDVFNDPGAVEHPNQNVDALPGSVS